MRSTAAQLRLLIQWEQHFVSRASSRLCRYEKRPLRRQRRRHLRASKSFFTVMPMLDPRYDSPSRCSEPVMRKRTGVTALKSDRSRYKTPPQKFPGRKSLLNASLDLPICSRPYLSRLPRDFTLWMLSLRRPRPVCLHYFANRHL